MSNSGFQQKHGCPWRQVLLSHWKLSAAVGAAAGVDAVGACGFLGVGFARGLQC